jgi:phosphotransferase system HPr-like phosphotransfer protein
LIGEFKDGLLMSRDVRLREGWGGTEVRSSSSLEITVVDALTGRTVRIEIRSDISVGLLVHALRKGFESPNKDGPCYLARGRDKLLGPDEYWMTLQVAGIREGDQLELVGRYGANEQSM